VKLSGPGEWLVERHGTQLRRAWRKLHLGIDARTDMIVASTLTGKEVDDAAELGALLDQVDEPLAAVVADGAYDQDNVSTTPSPSILQTLRLSCRGARCPIRRPESIQSSATGISRAWPSAAGWAGGAFAAAGGSKTSGYNAGAGAEGAMSRYKRIIGDTLRSHSRPAQEVETRIAVTVLNRMLDLGRPVSVRAA
jgi:hypothetical protein